jgi:hypothetical protein
MKLHEEGRHVASAQLGAEIMRFRGDSPFADGPCGSVSSPPMKVFRLSLAVVALFLAATPAVAQPALRPDYRPVVPGLDYAHMQMKSWGRGEPWSIHIARLDRSQKDLQIVSTLARNASFGLASISAQAKSIPKTTGLPLVAINTDFCILKRDPYQGTPRGLQITQGHFISPPYAYSFWVNEDGGMFLGNVASKLSATLLGGKTFPIGLNHRCGANQAVLFTSMIGKSTRATNCLELVLEDPSHQPLSWRAGQCYSLRVSAVNPSGNSPLSHATAVLSFGKAAADKVGNPRPGDEVRLDFATEPDLGKAATGVGCIFPLVHGGEVLGEFAGSRYLLYKHPRTAIGFNSRSFYMVVVDGRQKGLSLGMYPKELARFMVLLGCTAAMNLDGGGSSTFWLEGNVRNSPCGGKQRSLATGLAIVQRPPNNGRLAGAAD